MYTFIMLQCLWLSLFITLHCFHYSGTVIILEPFLAHCGAVNTVSMETSVRHTLISGLEQLYFSDDEWNLKSWEGFSWQTQLNSSPYIGGKRYPHKQRNLFDFSRYEEDNKWLLSGLAKSTLWLCLPHQNPASGSTFSVREQMGNNFQLYFTLKKRYIDLLQLFPYSWREIMKYSLICQWS